MTDQQSITSVGKELQILFADLVEEFGECRSRSIDATLKQGRY